jgi:hypothetical protein
VTHLYHLGTIPSGIGTPHSLPGHRSHLQRALLPGGIILQGVLLLQGSMSVFCMPLRLGANWGYWPSDSVFDQGGVHHN